MAIISSLFRLGKFGLTNPGGRLMTGAAIGGITGYRSGDEYTSFNNRMNSAFIGAGVGAAGGVGASMALRGAFWRTAGKIGIGSAIGGAKLGFGGAKMGIRLAMRPGVIMAGAATAATGGGLMMYESMARNRRRQRFQESASGLSLAAHGSRHR